MNALMTEVIGKARRRLPKLRQPKVEMLPLPFDSSKPRVLYILQAYPNFSETYMHEEIRSVSQDFNVRVVVFVRSGRPRRRAWKYDLIEYEAPELAYSNLEKINQEFSDPKQVSFVEKLDAIIEEFRPDLIHAHYLGLGLLVKYLAERHEIPFTLRTHSMDLLSEPDDKLDACCVALNSPWCQRVLAFPASSQILLDHGLDPSKLQPCWPVLDFQRFYRPESRARTGRVLCAGPAIPKKAHTDFVDLAAMMKGKSDLEFDLYAAGPSISVTKAHNMRKGSPVTIKYVDPEEMQDIYPLYDWLVYPSDYKRNKVGLPLAVAEALAAGIGVCWQELPGRRDEQLDFLGGAGYLFRSLDELPDVLGRPYPEEKRLAGFEAAKRFDIQQHRHLLTDSWYAAIEEKRQVART